MPPPAGGEADARFDLRLVPLLETATAIDGAMTIEQLRSARPRSGATVVTSLFGADEPFHSLVSMTENYADLLTFTDGRAAIAQLHIAPMREVALDTAIHLLSHFEHPAGTAVVHAHWEVERAGNRAIRSGRLINLDEFSVRADIPRLRRLIRSLAASSRFRPARPRLHAALLATARARSISGELVPELHAAAAVADVALKELNVGDPNDPIYLRELDRALAANNHHILVAMHEHEKWVWKRFKEYQQREGRVAVSLDPHLGETIVESFQSAMLNLADAAPARPTLAWGRDALRRIASRTGPAFELSKRARQHLGQNGYPDVERMLKYLERLADMAQAFHFSEGVSGRLAEWARTEFDIEIALHEDNITEVHAYFEFEGQRLCNRPHVKVDDYKNPAECGRIYFAIDDAKWPSLEVLA